MGYRGRHHLGSRLAMLGLLALLWVAGPAIRSCPAAASGPRWMRGTELLHLSPEVRDDPGEVLLGNTGNAGGNLSRGAGADGDRLLERLEWFPRGGAAWRATPTGAVRQLQARLAGIPVVGLEVKLHRDRQGQLRCVVLPAGLTRAPAPEISGEDGSKRRWSPAPGLATAKHRRWLWEHESLRPVYWIEPESLGADAEVLVLDGPTGEVLERRSAVHRLAQTTGRGLVFDPNPIVASGGLPLGAGDDIDPFRDWVTLRGLDGSGLLRGRWADVDSPAGRAFAADHEHVYSSRNLHFEEVMAYYHITGALDWLEALGFERPLPAPQPVLVHATGLDASWYAIASRTIHIGDGGQEDGEDADIILHELGHAIFHAQVGAWGGGDSDALTEGFADYLAASRTRGSRIGDWDGAGRPSGCLRDIAPPRTYPLDCTGNAYDDGLILSSLLWHLRGALGAPAADRLAVQALGLLAPSATLPDAAAALATAARWLAEAAGSAQMTAVVDEALVTWGFAPRRAQLSLDPLAPQTDGWLALDFTFLPPGTTTPRPCDSLRVRADGAVEFAGAFANGAASPAPVAAAFMAFPEPAAAAAYDRVLVSQEASLWDCTLEIRFLAAGATVRRTQLRLAADGALELAWFGEGDRLAFPAWSGYYPGGTTTGAARFDPRRDDERTFEAGCGVHFIPPGESTHTLAGARIRCQPNGNATYRLSVVSPPLPAMDTPEPQLGVFPTPAGRDGRVQFRIEREGRYELQLVSASGRMVARADLGRLEPGVHPVGLANLTSGRAGLTSGVFYLRLSGPGGPVVSRVLICE